nr:nascent polypeptide-associated complex subunit alpha, muscle-specific form-like [Aegilops tauschii subsp. strangulata]
MAPLFPAPVALDARRRCSSFSTSSSSSPRLCPDPAAATSARPSIFAAAPARLCSAPLLLYHGLPPSASRLHPSSPPQAAPSPPLAVPTSSRKPGAQALPWSPPFVASAARSAPPAPRRSRAKLPCIARVAEPLPPRPLRVDQLARSLAPAPRLPPLLASPASLLRLPGLAASATCQQHIHLAVDLLLSWIQGHRTVQLR